MSDTITTLRELEARATKGPWIVWAEDVSVHSSTGMRVADIRGWGSLRYKDGGAEEMDANAALIAAARNALPVLLAVAAAADVVSRHRSDGDGNWVDVTLPTDEWIALLVALRALREVKP